MLSNRLVKQITRHCSSQKVMKPTIEAHNTAFGRIKQVITSALAGLTFEIEHIGSTTIPGLSAKPILDIDIIIGPRQELRDAVKLRLERLGYESKGERALCV